MWLFIALALGSGCGVRTFVNLRTLRLEPRLIAILGGGGNSLVLVNGPEAFVTEAKMGGFARRMKKQIAVELGAKVKRMLLTHAHFDHAQGLVEFRDEVGAVIVHPRARAQLMREQNADDRLGWAPFVEVEDEIFLRLGDEEVRIFHPGTGHTDGDLVALLPAHRLLVAGDLILQGFEPVADEKSGGNMLEFRRTVDRLMALDFDQVLPGHGEMMTRAEASVFRDYLAAVEGAVRGAIAAGKGEAEAVESIQLPEYSFLKPIPLLSNRAATVRAMYQAVQAEAGGQRR